MKYLTKGTCSSAIEFDIVDGRVYNLKFTGGCSGNLQGICRLVEGMDKDTVVSLLKGICCGSKKTSCPDQLATALSAL